MARRRIWVSTEAAAPADRVWDLLTDWDRHDEWMIGTTATGGTGTGARVEARTALGPLGFTDTMIITGWHPPRNGRDGRCVVRHTGALIRGVGRFEVRELDSGMTRVTWTEDINLPLGVLGEIGWVAVEPAARVMLRVSLWRLSRLAVSELATA
jgi:carbon monoxide dehydrogenase subunit G